MPKRNLKPRFFNRELSWLEFNGRVLEEAQNHDNPALERLKFLSIVSSNFDEFFMVRVAAIKARLRGEAQVPDNSGLSPEALFSRVSERAHEITEAQYQVLVREILPALKAGGIHVTRPADWDGATTLKLAEYFSTQVAPLLTPLIIEFKAEEKLRLTANLRIHAAFLLCLDDAAGKSALQDKALSEHGAKPGREYLAVIQLPPKLGRFLPLVSLEASTVRMALIDDIVLTFGQDMFKGFKILDRLLFKVTRDADIGVDEFRDDDFVDAMKEVLVNRQSSLPVRLSVSTESERIASMLKDMLGLEDRDVYRMPGPIDLKSFMELVAVKGFDRLRFPPREAFPVFTPTEENSIWDELRKRDIVLHLPYESFSLVTAFFESAAADPAVLAIKATLYRTSGDSPVIKALTKAAKNGKQVTVIVELKARFDEERNIAWANQLEQAGAIVVYGVAHLKVHAKAAIVVRREEDGLIRRYAHVSTGNYDDRTAKLYADLSLFTTNPALCADLGSFFNMLTGLSNLGDLKLLSMAPFDLKRRLLLLIERETGRSTPESPGLIVAKINSLCDADIIEALYRASQAGVQVLLNVRGVCQLVPGVKGMSETINVVSVVGRVLEHSRILYCRNGGAEEMYISSADWMPRNLERRIELLFPVQSEAVRERIYDILLSYFVDTMHARALSAGGTWRKVPSGTGEDRFSAQDYYYAEAKRRFESVASKAVSGELQVRRKAP